MNELDTVGQPQRPNRLSSPKPFNRKRRFKVLPLDLSMCLSTKNHQRQGYHCKVYAQVTPVFHREGWYYDRATNKSWIEVQGEAFSMPVYRFKRKAKELEPPPSIDDCALEALRRVFELGWLEGKGREVYLAAALRKSLMERKLKEKRVRRYFRQCGKTEFQTRALNQTDRKDPTCTTT